MPGEAKPTSFPITWSDRYFWLTLGSQSICPQHSLWDWNHTLQNVCQQGQRSSSHWHCRGECADVPQWSRHLMGRFHLDTPHLGIRLDTELVVQSLSHVWLFVTLWTAARQTSLSIANSWSLLNSCSLSGWFHPTILCCPLLLPPSIFPSIRVFSNKSVLHIRWPKYCSFSFSISPSNEYSGLISLRIDWLDLLEVQGTL